MERALAEAKKAGARGEVPVGAVIVKNGAVVATGANDREASKSPLSHAELRALEAGSAGLGDWRLTDCTLVVTLEPCPMCLAACQQARVSRVVYGARDPKGGALSLGHNLHADARLNHRFEVEYLSTPEAKAVLKAFFSEQRAKKK